jgi:hypothetical protein
MLFKVYFCSRASNGMPASKHYKIETSSATRALAEAVSYTERHYKVTLIEIWDASAKTVTQEVWDTEDGYEVLH